MRFLRFRQDRKGGQREIKKSGFDEGLPNRSSSFERIWFVNDEQFARQMIESQRQSMGKSDYSRTFPKRISEEFIQKGMLN